MMIKSCATIKGFADRGGVKVWRFFGASGQLIVNKIQPISVGVCGQGFAEFFGTHKSSYKQEVKFTSIPFE